MLFLDVGKSNVLIIGIGSHFRREIRFHLVYNDLHTSGCKELLALLLFKCRGKVQNCCHGMYKRGVAGRHPGTLVCKIDQLYPFCLIDCILFFTHDETILDLFLSP